MIDWISIMTLQLMDRLIGGLLYLPEDAALAIVALGTSAILTFIRPFTTDQDLLRRCKQDKSRLGGFIREAKRAHDKAAVARYRATQGLIATKQMKAEFKPLLVAVLPIAMLAVWAFARLGYLPAQPGEPVTVNAYFPASAIGKVVHMVPAEGLSADSGWVRRVTEDPHKGPSGKVNGVATWTLKAAGRKEPYALILRSEGETVEKTLLVDGHRYLPVLELHEGGEIHAVEVALKRYRPFGFVPGIPQLLFDPWLVGYLLITIPFVFVLRWVCRIC